MSRVTCHVSPVTCHMSHVTCQIFFIYLFFGQSGEASQGSVCYQRGLPRPVFNNIPNQRKNYIFFDNIEEIKFFYLL